MNWRERMADLRAARRFSQAELARRLGRAQSWVSQVESGKIRLTLDEAIEVCGVLGCSVAELVGEAAPAARDEEMALLRQVRMLGCEEAQRRLLQAGGGPFRPLGATELPSDHPDRLDQPPAAQGDDRPAGPKRRR